METAHKHLWKTGRQGIIHTQGSEEHKACAGPERDSIGDPMSDVKLSTALCDHPFIEKASAGLIVGNVATILTGSAGIGVVSLFAAWKFAKGTHMKRCYIGKK